MNVVASYLNLGKDLTRILVGSCVRFDDRREYRHHVPLAYNYDRVLMFIVRARELWLRGDLCSSLRELGKAMHLLHDSLIPGPSRELRRLHNKLESALAKLQVPMEAVEKGFNERPKTFRELRNIVRSVSIVDGNPENIMFVATYLSTAIVSSVLLETNPPKDLEYEINRLGYFCYKRLKLEAIKHLSLSISILITIFTLPLITTIYTVTSPLIILATIIAIPLSIYAITWILTKRHVKKQPEIANVDIGKCREIVDEMMWFGLKATPPNKNKQ